MAQSLWEILSQRSNSPMASYLNPTSSIVQKLAPTPTVIQPKQIAPAPVKAGVSLADIVAIKKQTRAPIIATPLISEEPTTLIWKTNKYINNSPLLSALATKNQVVDKINEVWTKFANSYIAPITILWEQLVKKPVDRFIDYIQWREVDPSNQYSMSDLWSTAWSVVSAWFNVLPITSAFNLAWSSDTWEKVLNSLPWQVWIWAWLWAKLGWIKWAVVWWLVWAIPAWVNYIFETVPVLKQYADSLTPEGKQWLIWTIWGLWMIAWGIAWAKIEWKTPIQVINKLHELPDNIANNIVDAVKHTSENTKSIIETSKKIWQDKSWKIAPWKIISDILPWKKPNLDTTKLIPDNETLKKNSLVEQAKWDSSSPLNWKSSSLGSIDMKAYSEYRKTNQWASPSDFMKSQNNVVDMKKPKEYRNFEEYATENKASRLDFWDPSFHRWSKNMSERSKQSALKLQLEKDTQLQKKRAELQKEYDAKIKSWEIKEIPRDIQLQEIATNYPDTEQWQAAQRVIEKRNKLKAEKSIKPTPLVKEKLDFEYPQAIWEVVKEMKYDEQRTISKNAKGLTTNKWDKVNIWDTVSVEWWPWWWEFTNLKLIWVDFSTFWKNIKTYWIFKDSEWKIFKRDAYYINKPVEVVKPVEVTKPVETPKLSEIVSRKVEPKKNIASVDKINQAISQLEKQNDNMSKRVKQQPALAKNIRENINKINIFKKELERKTQAQMEWRAKKVPVSEIISQKPEEVVTPTLIPNMSNVEMLAERARQNRQIWLEMRKVIEWEQAKSKTLTDKIQENRMKEIYDDFIRNRLSQDELSTKIIDDTTLTEQNKESLINSFSDILSPISSTNIKSTKSIKYARYNELLDEVTSPDWLSKEDMASKINSDLIIDDKQKIKLIKWLWFNKKEVENILTTPKEELPPFGTPEEAAKVAQDNIDLGTTKKIVENSKLPEWQTEFKIVLLAFKNMSRSINLDTFLSKIQYYINGKYIGTLQNYIQRLKNTGKRVANQLADDYGVKNILKETNPEEVASTWKSIEKNIDDNLLWGKTQNEWTEVTQKNLSLIKNTLQEWGDMTYNETYGDINNKQLNDIAKINFVYELNKWNQAKIDSIIPKKLQELFQKYDEIYRKAYDAIWPYLVELGQISKYDIEEQYKRFVMLPWARKALEKLTGKSIFTTSDWVEHSTYLDMMTYIKNEKRRGGKGLTPSFDVGNMSSILKDKQSGVDLFRFNSPVIQALDYFRQVGDLTKADSIFSTFDELWQSKDPKVKAFVEWLYNNNGYQNVLEQSMGLGWKESKSKIVQWIQKTSWVSAKALLYASVSNLVQAISQGTIKTAILWNNPFKWTLLLRIKNPETRNIFQKYGIAQEFELSSAKELAGNKNVAFFSGTPIENAQKIAVALPIMKSTVEKLWTPEQIANIKKWWVDAIAKEFDSIIKSSDASVENQIMDLIYERTNYIGNVSSNARSSIWVLNKLWFTSLKTFSTNRLWQIQQNILKTISGKEISNIDAMFNEGKFQKLDQVSKGRISAAAKIMWPLLASYAVSEIYQQANKEDDDEKKKWLMKAQWDQIANQFVWNDYVLIRDYIANITSSTLNLPADLAKQLWESLMLIYKQKDKSEASKLWVDKLISFLLTKTAPWKLINQSTAIVSWETAWTKLADFLQVPNLEKQTAKMNAKWFWISTPQEAFAELMWVRSDTATQNYIYGLMQDAKVDEKYQNMPEIAKMFVSWVWDTYNKTARNLDTFALNLYSYQDMWKYNDQLVEENYVWAVIRNRDNNPNLSTFLQKIWIEDSLKNSIIEAKWGNLDQMRNVNNQIEKVINQNMLTNYIEWENFSDYLDNLEEQNPKWFNNFIGGIALTKKYIDENPELDFSDKWVVQDIKWFFNDSTTNIDAAVSDFSWKAPLSTGLTESLQQWLMQFQDKLGQKWGIEEAKKSLWDVQRIFDIILNNSKHTDWIIAATALKSTELKEILIAMREKGYKTFDKDFPTLTNIIKRWLELRGEVERDNVLMSKPTAPQISNTPTLSSIVSGQPITTNWNLSTWTLPVAIPQQKNKKLSDLIKQTKYQPQQLIWHPELPSSISLSEIVRRINSWRN